MSASASGLPHVIVVGNEKGGSGKTTIAMHLAMALLKAGQRVVTIDLDSRQQTLTRYLENRRSWASRTGFRLELPDHYVIPEGERCRLDENEQIEFAAFDRAVRDAQDRHDFVVIDTPPHDSYLSRLAHTMTDTLVTPLNDSFVDLDVLAKIDPVDFSLKGASQYGDTVREARRSRRLVDGTLMDWLVVPNRLGVVRSRNNQRLASALSELSRMLAFRVGIGLTERLIYREHFVRGLTALDDVPGAGAATCGAGTARSAQREVQSLVDCLRLPIADRGRVRAEAHAEWLKSRVRPLEVDDILAPPPDQRAA